MFRLIQSLLSILPACDKSVMKWWILSSFWPIFEAHNKELLFYCTESLYAQCKVSEICFYADLSDGVCIWGESPYFKFINYLTLHPYVKKYRNTKLWFSASEIIGTTTNDGPSVCVFMIEIPAILCFDYSICSSVV